MEQGRRKTAATGRESGSRRGGRRASVGDRLLSAARSDIRAPARQPSVGVGAICRSCRRHSAVTPLPAAGGGERRRGSRLTRAPEVNTRRRPHPGGGRSRACLDAPARRRAGDDQRHPLRDEAPPSTETVGRRPPQPLVNALACRRIRIFGCDEGGPPRETASVTWSATRGGPQMCVYTGLDLSRKRLDWYCCRVDGALVDAGAVPPDRDGLARLARRLGDAEVVAVVETMHGARFVHDQLELAGWDVRGHWRRWRARRIGSTRKCWLSSLAAIWFRRCGCPIRVVASASGLAFACTWSSTARCSRTASTRRWSRTAADPPSVRAEGAGRARAAAGA
jgi:hypothetical protein